MNVVSIGGGTGQGLLLSELRSRDIDLTAIATTLDSGRSSGDLRDALGMFAPGDLRNCMIALSGSDAMIKSILQHRFEGVVPGMNLGNLIFAAIHEMGLDFDEALDGISSLLRLEGRVYPSTTDPVHICASLADGSVLEREHRIVDEAHAPIVSIALSGEVEAYPRALEALENADLIIVGPGALYTSVAVHFAIDAFREAFIASQAHKVFVPNLAVQPNVTDGYSITDHLDALERMIGERAFDTIVVNTRTPSEKVAKRYRDAGSDPIIPSAEELDALRARVRVLEGDFLDETVVVEPNKTLYMRHDAKKLADTLDALMHKPLKGLVLAAGKGTRMEPYSRTTPKVLLELYGKPLIAYRIDELVEARVRDIVIVCSDETCGPIREYVDDRYPDVSFSFATQRDAKGPAHAIDCARGLIRGSRIVLTLADNLADEPLVPGLIKAASAPGACGAVALKRVMNPSEFGIARISDGQAIDIVEKPEHPPSDLAVMGTAVLDADLLLDLIAQRGYFVETSDGVREISAPQYFTDAGLALEISRSKARILDVGRPYDLIEAMRLVSGSGQVLGSVASDAFVSDEAYIGPSAVVGSHARIEGASQIDGIVEGGAIVSDSLVMEGARVGAGAHIERCVLGKSSRVAAGLVIPAADAPVMIKGKPMHPGRVGMFASEGALLDTCEQGRIV